MSVPDLATLQKMFRQAPFVADIGMELESLGDGECVTVLRVEPRHLQQNGVVGLHHLEAAVEVDLDPAADVAQPVGGEAAGATKDARQLATRLVSIPMLGGTESLNAAVAGSILMFEVLRQRSSV